MEDKEVVVTVLWEPHLLVTLDNFMNNGECNNLIRKAEAKGWSLSAPSPGGNGRTGKEEPRTNSFAVIYDNKLAVDIWNRIKEFIPPDLTHIPTNTYLHHDTKGAEWKPVGVVDKIRFYKYEVGQKFPEHVDYRSGRDITRLEDGEFKKYRQQTFVTLLIYLNEDFSGGTTNYWRNHDDIHCRFLKEVDDKTPSHHIQPKTGRAVLQEQTLWHEGSAPTSGTKYILRTDIIHEKYRPPHPKIKNQETKEYIGEWERIFEVSCKNYAE